MGSHGDISNWGFLMQLMRESDNINFPIIIINPLGGKVITIL